MATSKFITPQPITPRQCEPKNKADHAQWHYLANLGYKFACFILMFARFFLKFILLRPLFLKQNQQFRFYISIQKHQKKRKLKIQSKICYFYIKFYKNSILNLNNCNNFIYLKVISKIARFYIYIQILPKTSTIQLFKKHAHNLLILLNLKIFTLPIFKFKCFLRFQFLNLNVYALITTDQI